MWRYRAPAVVLGCSQRALRDDVALRLGARAALLLRESGGGAVLAGPWLVGVSVLVPNDHPWVHGGVVASYRDFADVHLAALADIGIAAEALAPADVAAANAARPVVRWACFGSLSPWEIVAAGGRKLVGLAQRRRRNAVLLVAGTLVDAPDWPLLCDAAGHPEDLPLIAARTVACHEVAGRPVDTDRFADALDQRLRAALAPAAGQRSA